MIRIEAGRPKVNDRATVNILCYAWHKVSTLSICYDNSFPSIHHKSPFTLYSMLGRAGVDSDRWQQSYGGE